MGAGDATRCPTMHNTAPTIKNFLAQYISSAKVAKLHLANSLVLFLSRNLEFFETISFSYSFLDLACVPN